MKVSIIIPIYNAEKYLHECLDSLVNQTLQDIEIICVDDGSSDNSIAILQEYQKQHPNVSIIRQPNSGAGAARNNGLEHAVGEYVLFLDADDYMALDACEVMYKAAAEHHLDVVKTKAQGFDEQTLEPISTYRYDMTYAAEEDFYRVTTLTESPFVLTQVVSVVPWNGIYRREFLLKHKIRFNSLKCVNDRSFYNNVIIHAERIMLLPIRSVYHRMNVSTSLVSGRAKNFECHFKSFDIIKEQSKKLPDPLRAAVLSAEISDIFTWYNKFKDNPIYGPGIREQMDAFVRSIDFNFFIQDGVFIPWLEHWNEYTANMTPEEKASHLQSLALVYRFHGAPYTAKYIVKRILSILKKK